LNPDEGVWHYLKHVELAAAEERLRRKPDIIRACFQQVGYL